MDRSQKTSLYRTVPLAIAFALLAALVVIAEIAQNGQKQINQRVGLSQKQQIVLAQLLEQVTQAESGQRGYLLTGDPQYLQPYHSARERIEPLLDQLSDLFRDNGQLLANPVQRDAMRHIRLLVGAKLSELDASLALYNSQGPAQALALVRTDLGSSTMLQIRNEAAKLRDAQQSAVSAEIGRAERLRMFALALMGGVVLLNVGLLVTAATLLARQARRRAVLTEQLASQNEELERAVRRRTAELSALSSHLQRLSEKEKAALARELHDELGGLLIAVKMDISWLQKHSAGAGEPDMKARWTRVLQALDEGVDFKRRVVENLRPTLLDNMGLLPAVRWITQETCARAGLRCVEVYPEEEPEFLEDAAIMIFRLLQESLTNIVKHAQATEVAVEITMGASDLTVTVSDNGLGIDSDRREAVGSHGLATMRHRVRSFGGSIEIDRPLEGGTRVRARLPLAQILRAPRVVPMRAAAAP
jgi:signal transduction histidine kinase